MKASAQGNVRIADYTYAPENPAVPRKAVITFLNALAAGSLTALWLMIRDHMKNGITPPEEIENLNLEVVTLVPYSKTQQKRDFFKSKFKKTGGRPNYLLTSEDRTNTAAEAIHALRTNIYFSTLDAPNNVLVITGAAPGTGKSFISANLAAVMAQPGKRVLLIDTDMRKGYLDRLFGPIPEFGLSDILDGKAASAKAVQETGIENLHLISSGNHPSNPSGLLMDNRFNELLAHARQRYDYVILDTPPILAVTDAVIIGRHAGTVLMISRYAHTRARELEVNVECLKQNHINIKGVIFSDMKREANNSYDYYAYDAYHSGSNKS